MLTRAVGDRLLKRGLATRSPGGLTLVTIDAIPFVSMSNKELRKVPFLFVTFGTSRDAAAPPSVASS
jgi:hypothetical protein